MSHDRTDELERAGFESVTKSGTEYTATYFGIEQEARNALPDNWLEVDLKGTMDGDVLVAAKPRNPSK